jgi:hypothetical protein
MGELENVVLAQSGGPTPVTRDPVRDVVVSWREQPERFGTVYTGVRRIEGILREESEAKQREGR